MLITCEVNLYHDKLYSYLKNVKCVLFGMMKMKNGISLLLMWWLCSLRAKALRRIGENSSNDLLRRVIKP